MVDVFLGSDDSLSCTVILKAKQFIYTAYCREIIPKLKDYLLQLKQVINVENFISRTPKQRQMWFTKWEPVLESLDIK